MNPIFVQHGTVWFHTDKRQKKHTVMCAKKTVCSGYAEQTVFMIKLKKLLFYREREIILLGGGTLSSSTR